MIWGDSHARQLSYGLLRALPDWDVLQVTSNGCMAATEARDNRQNFCEYSNWFAMQTIAREAPDVVIVGQNLGHNLANMISIGEALRKLRVKKVIFTGPTPHWLPDFYEIVAYQILPATPRRTKIGLDQSVIASDANFKAVFPQSSGMRYVSLIDQLCDADGCIVYFGDDIKSGLATWDYGHLTPTASLEIGKSLALEVRNFSR